MGLKSLWPRIRSFYWWLFDGVSVFMKKAKKADIPKKVREVQEVIADIQDVAGDIGGQFQGGQESDMFGDIEIPDDMSLDKTGFEPRKRKDDEYGWGG